MRAPLGETKSLPNGNDLHELYRDMAVPTKVLFVIGVVVLGLIGLALLGIYIALGYGRQDE